MGLEYSAAFSTAVTAQQDLFEIAASSSVAVIIHQIIVSQSTDMGDVQEEGLRLIVKRGATTTGSGGSTVTPVPLLSKYPAASSTVKANNTTKATSGTIVTAHTEAWIIRSAFVLIPTPELRISLGPSQRLTLELATTPNDSITVDGTLYFEEIG